MPGALARTRSLACELEKARKRSHHRYAASTGIPCAMVLTVSFVLSPVTGLFCQRRLQVTTCKLDSSVGAQDHTTSPSALAPLVSASPKRPPHPAPNVRDDRDTSL
jgi:hypothetical protein